MPVAEIAGKKVYLADVDAAIESRLYHHLTEIYDDRSTALNKLIEWDILNAEAAKRGMTYNDFTDSLYRVEIYNHSLKVGQLTYIQDTTGFDISYEQGRQVILQKSERDLRKRWVDSLSGVYQVKINLTKPDKILKVDMSDVKCYYKNGDTSPLTLWVISDFDCSVCKELQPVFESVGEKFKGKINYAYVFFSGMVTRSAIAAECAERQGKFWEMKKLLYDNTTLDAERYLKYAGETGMDTVRFKQDFNDPVTFDTINRHIETLQQKGIFGTPTIVIGNRMYLNVSTEDQLTRLIEKELK